MALIFMEGFDHWGSGDAWPFANTSFAVTAFTGGNTRHNYGQAVTLSGSSAGGQIDFGSNLQTVIAGMACLRASSATTLEAFRFRDTTNVQVNIQVNWTNRRVEAYRGSGTSNLLGQSADNSIPAFGTWVYIEVELFVDNSTGYVKVWADGSLILNLTAQDTQATANAYATNLIVAPANTLRIDDLYVFDTTGSRCNAVLGDARIYTLWPTADDAVQFTPSAGSNFQNVDDATDVDDDSTYNSSPTTGHKDIFTLTDLPAGAAPVAVEVRTTMRKDDAGTREVRAITKQGATQANGTTRTLNTTYAMYRDRFETDPDGNDWTEARVNSLKAGYEVVT